MIESMTRLMLSDTSIAGYWFRAARARESIICPSRIERVSSATGSFMSSPATSTV